MNGITKMSNHLIKMKISTVTSGILVVMIASASALPAIQPHHGHMHKRQSYARSNQLPPQEPFGQPSYNNYNYYSPRGQTPSSGGGYYDRNGFGQPGYNSPQYEYSPQQQYNHNNYGRGDPIQGSYAHVNPIQRELTVRNGQLRQKEYQQRTGAETRDTYDPFYFYVNPIAAQQAAASGAPLPPPSSVGPSPVASPTAPVTSREHVGGPPRNRRNSLNARDHYFDNEISGNKYDILTKPALPRNQNGYPYQSGRYSSGVPQGPYHHSGGNQNQQFLNYEQIVGAEPPRYASGSPTPPRGGQPWSIQIGTQLKVNDDGKGGNSGSRYYVRDERNTRPRQPPYRK